jgi:probable HAF family extracellular repeat protein
MDLHRRSLTLGALAGAALAFSPLARAVPRRYLIEALTDQHLAQVVPQAINAPGMATGSASTSWPGRYGKAFKGVPGRMRSAPWNGEGSSGLGINDLGVVVGKEEGISYKPAWRWDETGFTPLTIAGAPVLDHAADINNAGLIVGTSMQADMWITDGQDIRWLPRLPDQVRITAGRINNAGVACGTRFISGGGSDSFVWDGDLAAPMELPFLVQQAADINDLRQVCGHVSPAADQQPQAFLWDDGRLTLLDSNADFIVRSSAANAVNNPGVVVGDALIAPKGTKKHHRTAFIWEDGLMRDLNAVTDAAAQGWFLATAQAINDRGQIIGRGGATRHHRLVGYLATPVD